MIQNRLEFTEPGRVRVTEHPAPHPDANQVLVRTHYSAISPGTEMLVYRGKWPAGVALDKTIEALAGPFSYPLSYGYSAVGQVVEIGSGVRQDWHGRRVFAFQPHQDLFCADVCTLLPIPDDLDDETALFLPSMETAVNLMLDGRPLIGERVIVFGQGIIGLFATALLSYYPIAELVTLDRYPSRREISRRLGAQESLDPDAPDLLKMLGGHLSQGGRTDLIYELSGNPAGLSAALSLCRFSGRVVIGSWYGDQSVDLALGSFYHRGRVSLISSQVSTIAPDLSGCWNNGRRQDLAWEMLRRVRPSSLITHRFTLAEVSQAYQLVDRSPEQTIQVILDYRTVPQS